MVASNKLLHLRSVLGGRRNLARQFSGYFGSNGDVHTKSSIAVSPMAAMGIIMMGAMAIDHDLNAQTRLDSPPAFESVEEKKADEDSTTDVINWSGTHKVSVKNENFWEPESIAEVEAIVRECHRRGQALRPLGSSLSPNGIALNEAGMISMANLDSVLDIDTEKMTITVEAGITVQRVRINSKYVDHLN